MDQMQTQRNVKLLFINKPTPENAFSVDLKDN